MSDDAPAGTSRPDPLSLPTVQQRGFYYEELQEGVRYVHIPGKTVEDAENGIFSALTMNPAALHHDAVAGEQGEYGKRLVNSLLTLSTLVGLSVGHITVGTTVANLGFARVDFPAPVFAGDTLFASTVVLSKRLSRSRPEVGIVVLEHTARNQDGVVVCVAERTAMMRRQPQEAGS